MPADPTEHAEATERSSEAVLPDRPAESAAPRASRRALTVGIGEASRGIADEVLALGPHHPSAHGVMLLHLALDPDLTTITGADAQVGFVHRGAEKLFEARDLRQCMALANRHDWHGALGSELGLALLAEDALGIEVPERASWTRVLLCELQRIASHLAFLGAFPLPGQDVLPVPRAFTEQQQVVAALELVTGHRMHHTFMRVGGVAAAVPGGWLATAREVVGRVRTVLPQLQEDLLGPPAATELAGVGCATESLVHGHGASGPVARAAGLDVDLRRDRPYAFYGELFGEHGPGRVVHRPTGDVLARTEVRLAEVEVSCDLVDAAADRLASLGPGPVGVTLPKVVKLPEGEYHASTENPLGHNGWYLVSDGGRTPDRLRVRTASFNHASMLSALLVGVRLEQLAAVVASLGLVTGDIDK